MPYPRGDTPIKHIIDTAMRVADRDAAMVEALMKNAEEDLFNTLGRFSFVLETLPETSNTAFFVLRGESFVVEIEAQIDDEYRNIFSDMYQHGCFYKIHQIFGEKIFHTTKLIYERINKQTKSATTSRRFKEYNS